MKELLLGKIVNTVGLKGELKLLTDPLYGDTEFGQSAVLTINDKNYVCAAWRRKNRLIVFSLQDYQDINLVEGLIGASVKLAVNQLKKRKSGEYYCFELLDFKVYDQENQELGVVTGIDDNRMQRILRIRGATGKEILVPWVDFFVKEIAAKEKRIRIESIKGLV